MALDNAEFISELSIADPPGTDPLNQGDDHIRTTKKAVQQSFPNVGSAVPQTGVQMAQMAIKNEVNVFTQANQFASGQLFTDEIRLQQVTGFGTQVRYQTDLGVVRWQTAFTAADDFDIQRFSAAGAFVDNPISIDATNGRATFAQIAFFNSLVRIGDGSAVSPSLSFNSRPTDGMFSNAVNEVGFATSSTVRALIKSNGIELMVGQVGAPSYSFIGDNDTGMFQFGANQLSFATGGVERLRVDSSAMTVPSASILGRDASVTNPTYAFENQINLGLFRSANNVMAFTSNNSIQMSVTSRGVNMVNLPTNTLGLLSGDLWQTGGDVRIVP